MPPDYYNRHVQRWMSIFSDDEPDLMGMELVREFDNLTNKFYSIFHDNLVESDEGSELYLGIRSEVFREEVYVKQYDSYSVVRPRKDTKVRKIRRKVGPVSVPVKRRPDNVSESEIRGVEQDSLEDIIVTDKSVKIVSQLPINNRKENLKVIAYDDNSVTISYLSVEGKRCTHTSDIPYDIDCENAKATYKNGILEVKFDRK